MNKKRGRILVIKHDGQNDLTPPSKNGGEEQGRTIEAPLELIQYIEMMRDQFKVAISLLAQNITELEARVTLLTEKVNERQNVS